MARCAVTARAERAEHARYNVRLHSLRDHLLRSRRPGVFVDNRTKNSPAPSGPTSSARTGGSFSPPPRYHLPSAIGHATPRLADRRRYIVVAPESLVRGAFAGVRTQADHHIRPTCFSVMLPGNMKIGECQLRSARWQNHINPVGHGKESL